MHVLFIVHGMGSFSDQLDSHWAKPIKQLLKKQWKVFFPNVSFDDSVKIVPLTYDTKFRTYWQQVANEADVWGRVLADANIDGVVDAIKTFDDEEANFIVGSILDVLLYRGARGFQQYIRASVQYQIIKAIREYWDPPNQDTSVEFSVLAHSLGTAVMHDTLDQLSNSRVGDHPGPFSMKHFRLKGYMTLANVSRVLYGSDPSFYTEANVRPFHGGQAGLVSRFVNVHHQADPFVFPGRFSPPWSGEYKDVKVHHLYDLNTHGYEHYLTNPVVCARLFQAMYGWDAIPETKLKQVRAQFPNTSAPNVAAARALINEFEQALKNLFNKDDVGVGPALINAANALRKHRVAITDLGLGA